VLGLMGTAVAAWACISVATFRTTPTLAKPGEAVTVTGLEFHTKAPAVVHWNAVDGPVLASFEVKDARFSGQVTIPADAKPGNYVLVATQDPTASATTWGIPARALIQVVGEGGNPVVGEQFRDAQVSRPVGLVQERSATMGNLALAALGAGGLAMFIAGMAALTAGRRKAQAQPVRSTQP
jgi:hypothetical protein